MFIITCQFSLIKHQGQKVAEIKILCTNNQPDILANRGTEVLFQCQFNLCEIYQIYFVGEISLKLPATNIEFFSTEVAGSSMFSIFDVTLKLLFSFNENECTNAAKEYDFNTPSNRHFIIAEPIDRKSSSESLVVIET